MRSLDLYTMDNYIHSKDPDTTSHGTSVVNILSTYTPKSLFGFYRVVIDNEENPSYSAIRTRNLLNAMEDAMEDAHVLNLSLGTLHEDCNQRCRVCTYARKAVENNTIVVAAMGNIDREEEKNDENEDCGDQSVYCPALADEVITVGGYVPRCQSKITDSEDSSQLWATYEDDPIGPFCGGFDCSEEASCGEHLLEQWWEGNVEPEGNKPDVLAPVLYPVDRGEEPPYFTGTSFAAPIVSGVIASILSDLFPAGLDPTPGEVQEAIRTTSIETVENSDTGKINMKDAKEYLSKSLSPSNTIR